MPDISSHRNSICIIGAGPLGLAAALALQQSGHTPLLLDARPVDVPHSDKRVLALSHGSRMLLEKLGAWPAAQATAITQIHISQRGALGRTLMQARDYSLPALGYVLPASALVAALEQACDAAGLTVRHGCAVVDMHSDESGDNPGIDLQLADNISLRCALAVICEGQIDADEDDIITCDYDQHALLARVSASTPHGGLAWERFTPEGPIALLPLGEDYSLVWTQSPARIDDLFGLDDATLLAQLQQAFGPQIKLRALHDRARHPLGLRARRKPVGERRVWLGNAAQTLHPVAGQGFNLALRDAWEFAALLRGESDPGSAELLSRHARNRLPDRVGAAAFTDSLVRLFSNSNPVLTHMRGAALLALDVLPPLRHFVAKRMLFGARAWP